MKQKLWVFRLYACFVFCFVFQVKIFSQPIHKANVINSDQGLSQNSVYAIHRDVKGFLWIGTGDGLNRYDGKQVKVFRKTSSNSGSVLKGFSVHSMTEDNQHNLWFSTERNLVQYHMPSQVFTEIIPFDDSASYPGNKVLIDVDTLNNTIWLLQPAVCIFNYNYVTKKFKRFNLPGNATRKMIFLNSNAVLDAHGNIWMGSTDGLYGYDIKKNVWKQYYQGYELLRLCKDAFGKIWLLNENNLYSFDPATLWLKVLKNHKSKSNTYISLAADQRGFVWVGTLNGILYYASSLDDEINWGANINALASSQNILELRCLYVDRDNLLWIGTEGGGVIQVNLEPANFHIFPNPDDPGNLKTLYIKSIFCDDDSKVWLGTFKKGIYILDPGTGTSTVLPIPANKNFKKFADVVYTITKDAEGIYWIGYDGCLIAYNKSLGKFYFHNLPGILSDKRPIINKISFHKNEMLLSATTGLYKVVTQNAGSSVSFKKILSTAIMEALYTSDGSFWASSLYVGLIKVYDDLSFTTFFKDNGFRCLTEDKEHGILWGASQMGLLAYHLQTGKSRFYNESDGLMNTYLYGIIRDGKEIWVSSNNGISCARVNFKNGSIFPTLQFKNYFKPDGLQSNEFNTGAYAISKEGVIYFGGINGLNWFQSKNISENKYRPAVSFTSLKINDKAYAGDTAIEFKKAITVQYNANTLTIGFMGLEFSNPKGISYQYKLEGLEKDWTYGKNTDLVRYANLAPGTYQFRLMASNADGLMGEEASLLIQVLPPFYSTWWFRLLMAILVISMVIIITHKLSQYKLKRKIRHLEKLKLVNDERIRISKEMHDDLGAGLTQISLISEAAKQIYKEGGYPQEELKNISATSRQLIENVSEIIWAMNPEFDTISGMFAYLREQLGKLLEYSGKSYELNFPENYTEGKISNIRRKNISMLLKEAVNNSIKHSHASSVFVKLSIIGNTLHMEVKDNGHGFDTTTVSCGNGLKNFTYRSALIGGSAKIISHARGTEIYFSIPL